MNKEQKIVEEQKIAKEKEDEIRPCTCGSGIHWAICPGIPDIETPWAFCG